MTEQLESTITAVATRCLAVGRANRPGNAVRPAWARLAGDDRTCRGAGGGARLRSAGRRARRLHGREDAGCASDARRHRCARARGSLRSDVRRRRPAGGRSSIQTERTNDGSPFRAKDPAHRRDGISRSGADSGTSRDDVGDPGVSGEATIRPVSRPLGAGLSRPSRPVSVGAGFSRPIRPVSVGAGFSRPNKLESSCSREISATPASA